MIDLSDSCEVKQLVENCIKGDRKASRKLFQMFYGKMLFLCMRYAQDKDEAKDMVQEGFIKVFESLKDFEYKGSLGNWVKKIITNIAVDMVRKKKDFIIPFEENKNYDNCIDEYNENLEAELVNKTKADVIIALIQKLSPVYRTVFNLHIFEGLQHKEIAERLNISIGTSKSNYAKARRNLIRLIEKHNNGHKQ